MNTGPRGCGPPAPSASTTSSAGHERPCGRALVAPALIPPVAEHVDQFACGPIALGVVTQLPYAARLRGRRAAIVTPAAVCSRLFAANVAAATSLLIRPYSALPPLVTARSLGGCYYELLADERSRRGVMRIARGAPYRSSVSSPLNITSLAFGQRYSLVVTST